MRRIYRIVLNSIRVFFPSPKLDMWSFYIALADQGAV